MMVVVVVWLLLVLLLLLRRGEGGRGSRIGSFVVGVLKVGGGEMVWLGGC